MIDDGRWRPAMRKIGRPRVYPVGIWTPCRSIDIWERRTFELAKAVVASERMAAALHIRDEGENGMKESEFSCVWFITETSSGFGLLLAEEALKRGERVIARSQRLSPSQTL